MSASSKDLNLRPTAYMAAALPLSYGCTLILLLSACTATMPTAQVPVAASCLPADVPQPPDTLSNAELAKLGDRRLIVARFPRREFLLVDIELRGGGHQVETCRLPRPGEHLRIDRRLDALRHARAPSALNARATSAGISASRCRPRYCSTEETLAYLIFTLDSDTTLLGHANYEGHLSVLEAGLF